MDTSVETLEDNKVRLHIAIPEQEFESAIDAAFRKLASKVRIDGFRPGKAPRRVLEAPYRAESRRCGPWTRACGTPRRWPTRTPARGWRCGGEPCCLRASRPTCP